MKKRIPVKVIKEEKKVEDLEDLIRQFEEDYPEEMSMLDQALQDNDPESAKVALSPEVMALINKEEPGASDDVKDMLAALDKSDADRAAKEKSERQAKAAREKAEKARQAAIKLLVDNPQSPVTLDPENPGNNIYDAILKWDPYPGLLPEDTPPEAKKRRTESLQNLMSSLKTIFENVIRDQGLEADQRFLGLHNKPILDYWIKNGRTMDKHYIPFDIGRRPGESYESVSRLGGSARVRTVNGERIVTREIRPDRYLKKSYGLAHYILYGLRKAFSLVRADGFPPELLRQAQGLEKAIVVRDPNKSRLSPGKKTMPYGFVSMISYLYFQATYPDMALKESLLSGFDKESEKHLIGRVRTTREDGFQAVPSYNTPRFRPDGGSNLHRSFAPRFVSSRRMPEPPQSAVPITFQELQQTIDTWKSNLKSLSSMEFKSSGVGRKLSPEMLSIRHSKEFSEQFKDPREPYQTPEAKKKAKDRDYNPESDVGTMFKYYMDILNKADDLTGGAVKRNVSFGSDKIYTGSEQDRIRRENKERLIRIIKEEVLNVLSEQQPPRSVRLRRGMVVHRQLKNPGGVAASVKQLQTKLDKLGFTNKPFSIDGDYGNATMAAVKAFQQKNNLKQDGIAGKNTIATLMKASQQPVKQQSQTQAKKDPQQAAKQQASKPKRKGFRSTTNVTMRNYPGLIMNSGNQVLLAMAGMGGNFEKVFSEFVKLVKDSKKSGQIPKQQYSIMIKTLKDKTKDLSDRIRLVTKQMAAIMK